MGRSIILCAVILIIVASVSFAGPQDTSSTTGTNLIAQARVYLAESSALKWSEAQLLQFLNDGTVDIASKTLCYQGTENVNLVANTVEYTPSTSYIKVVAAIVNPASGASYGLKRADITIRGGDKVIDFDQPVYFYEFGGKVGIFPAYSAVTTETATLYLAKKPAAIAAGGSVPTPTYLDKALVYYITAQALLVDRRPNEAGNYLNLYFRELDRYRQDFIGADIDEKADTVR
jgi:hypothetical protein